MPIVRDVTPDFGPDYGPLLPPTPPVPPSPPSPPSGPPLVTLQVTSANEIIADALQKLGVYAPGEILTDADVSLGLTQLNALIDDWLADSIYLYQVVEVQGILVANMQDYTVGPGGMINVPRPIRVVLGRGIGSAVLGNNAGSGSVDSVSGLEWRVIYSPANNVVGAPIRAVPAAMYYEPQNPLGLLSVSPLPAANGAITFPALYGMTNFADLTSNYILAPAQEQGLKANLAIALNPYFGGSIVSPELIAEAQQNKTTLTLINRLSRAMAKRNAEPMARGTVPR